MKKTLFWLSVLLNIALIGALAFLVDRLGGPRFAWHRFRSNQVVGTYVHRRGLFEKLPVKKGDIVLLGDSNTQENEWREMLGDSLPIRNRAIVGDGISGVLSRLDAVLAGKPSKIFLMIGTNDLLFGMNERDAMFGYRQIVEKIRRQSPETELILESVLPVNPSVQNLSTTSAATRELNASIQKLAAENHLKYIDVAARMANATGDLDRRFTDDGIHLNAEGYRVWASELAPFLR